MLSATKRPEALYISPYSFARKRGHATIAPMKELPPRLVHTIRTILQKYPTPLHIYDEEGIRKTAREMKTALSWVPDTTGAPGGYKNYFAVKALPNPHILAILKEEGMGVDCSSLPELVLAQKVGFTPDDIIFTSNNTPLEEYKLAKEMDALINLDDIGHIDYIHRAITLPQRISFRYNPGASRTGTTIIGRPEEAKFGLTTQQILEAYPAARSLGCTSFGLHTMVISNELNPQYFVETATMLFELVVKIHKESGIKITLINLGGGIGVPYRPHQQRVPLEKISEGIARAYHKIIVANRLHPIRIVSEYGRAVTAPSGYLVCKVRHIKKSYKNYVGVDANMSDLMRPAMYGAYHHITALTTYTHPTENYDITGSLCENNDKFAVDRSLPRLKVGDILVIHDTGAHGHAMGFNYNGKLRHAEVLLEPSGRARQIRRAETLENYFATLDF